MSSTLSLSKQLQSCSHVEPGEASEAFHARRQWDDEICFKAPKKDQYGRPVKCINGYTCKNQGGCLEAEWAIHRENRVQRPPVEQFGLIDECVCNDDRYAGFGKGISKAIAPRGYSYF